MTGPLSNASAFNAGLILAVLAAILWGLTYCLDERVLASLSVFKLYFLHCLCGAMVGKGGKDQWPRTNHFLTTKKPLRSPTGTWRTASWFTRRPTI